MKKMSPVVHFELPANDTKRMANFYSKAFGWKPDFLGPEMNGYVVVQTSETTEDGFPKKKGMINGGLYQRTKDPGTQHPSIVISVDDLDEAMETVKKAGGTVVDKPQDIPGIGLFVSIIDTEGNRISMLQPSPDMK